MNRRTIIITKSFLVDISIDLKLNYIFFFLSKFRTFLTKYQNSYYFRNWYIFYHRNKVFILDIRTLVYENWRLVYQCSGNLNIFFKRDCSIDFLDMYCISRKFSWKSLEVYSWYNLFLIYEVNAEDISRCSILCYTLSCMGNRMT
jgi:hypothetical protein